MERNKFAAALVMLSFVLTACGDDDDADRAFARNCSSGSQCASDEYCSFPDGACGGSIGSCVAIPEVCTEIFAPVCGCDGTTYENDCFAGFEGVSVRSQGECS